MFTVALAMALQLMQTREAILGDRVAYASDAQGFDIKRTASFCLMEAELKRPVGTHLGFISDKDGTSAIVLSNKAWQSIEDGETVPVEVSLAGATTTKAFGVKIKYTGGWTAGAIFISMPQHLLTEAFTKSSPLNIRTRGMELYDGPLSFGAAYLKLLECAAGSVDPFAK